MNNFKISFPPATADDIRQELAKILQNPLFSGSKRFKNFLGFIVEETLAGRSDSIKAYTIATSVLGRSPSFDPQADPIVRVEAARLRAKLDSYYAANLQHSKLKIELPKGSYRPNFYYLIPSNMGPNMEQNAAANSQPNSPPNFGQNLSPNSPAQLKAASQPETPPETNERAKPSIVVLPFVSLNNNQTEIDYLAHGFAEEISIGLSHFEDLSIISAPYPGHGPGLGTNLGTNLGPNLGPNHAPSHGPGPGLNPGPSYNPHPGPHPGHGTIFPDPPWSIAKSLRARFVLYGSTQIIANVLRIRVSLIDAHTKSSLWAEKFDRNYTASALFEILDEITTQVVTQVADSFGRINRFLSREGSGKRTSELEVYEAVLRYHYWLTTLSLENGQAAKKALTQAIELDPSYALPYALLSDVYSVNYQWGRELSPEYLDKSMALAVKSLDLDAKCQYAQWAMAFNYYLRGEGEQFIQFAKEAVRINPYNTNITVAVGLKTCMLGQWDEGLALIDQGSRLNFCLPGWFHVAWVLRHYLNQNFSAALTQAKLMTTPDFMCGPLMRTAIYGHLGMAAEGKAELGEFLKLCPDFAKNHQKLLQRLFFKPEYGEKIMQGLAKAGF